MSSRTARLDRETKESKVHVEVDLDGSGRSDIATGVGFFDHMLASFARHALVDLTVSTDGDTHIDAHHTVEDTAIVLGQALREALGDKVGIRRFGDALVPLDEALVQCAVDVSGRPYCVHVGEPDGQAYVVIGGEDGPGYPGSLTRHVFETLAFHAPPRGGAVQGLRPSLPRRGRPRPARDRSPLHQGQSMNIPRRSSSPPLRSSAGQRRGDPVPGG